MFRIALVNMPFASLKFPSLALTQLKAVLETRFAERVSVEIVYLNHDFARYLGTDKYRRIAIDVQAPYNGLGDWFFRQAAFPDVSDNIDLYFQRFYPARNEHNENFKCFIRDKRVGVDAELDSYIDRYGLDQVDILGFTSMFTQNVACFSLARRLRQRGCATTIVMGGANCEAPMGAEIARCVPHIDFVFSGTGLKSFPEFVQYSLDGDFARRSTIRGVFSRDSSHAGTPAQAIGEELPLNVPIPLDYAPFLARLDQMFPDEPIDPILLFETSRGCWWGERAHCTFCGLNGHTMAYRTMPADDARSLIKSLFRYSERVSRLQCVDNILPKNYPREVFAGLDTPDHMSIFYEVKADLSEEEVAILARARVREVQPGIEALATSTLKLMRKGTTVFTNLRFLKLCSTYDIVPDWSLLIGFPGEGEEVYRKYVDDIPNLVHLPPPGGAHPVRPDRYSPYHVRAADYGLDVRPADFYELVYPFPAESLNNLAYFFRDNNFGADYFLTMVKWYEPVNAVVEKWRTRWDPERYAVPPMLYRKTVGGQVVICDSRGGEMREYPLDATSATVLGCLAKPRRLDEVGAELSAIPELDLAGAVAGFDERGLVFHERGQVMSLVLDTAPPVRGEAMAWSWAS